MLIIDLLKVIELIGRENVKLHPKQISEIVHMLGKDDTSGNKPTGQPKLSSNNKPT